jgi:hypothetical protein
MGQLRVLIKNQLPEYWLETLEDSGAMEPLLNNIIRKYFSDKTVSFGKCVNKFKCVAKERSLKRLFDFSETPEGSRYWHMIEQKLFNSHL